MDTAITYKKTSVLNKVASAVVRGTGKTLDSLVEASRKLEPLASAPIIGDSIKDVQDLLSMINDYFHGRYRKVPTVVIIGSMAIVGYLLSPFDLIPDNVPLLGFVDDALIINVIMDLCVNKELERYRNWLAGA